ncbi:MAG: hypothetical protein GY780_00085 [bacterium]|nr:hypothetical protein [bacterium]
MSDLVTVPYDFDDEMMARTQTDQISRVRVYQWDDVSVVIGRGGKQDLELHTQNIAADKITLYKRPGGGCSVVLDPGNLIVSIALPLPGIGGIKTAFSAVSHWLIDNLNQCGISGVVQRGVSDLVIGDRKIGGSCVYRTKGLLYYSTTLLVDHDSFLVSRFLKHPPREPGYRKSRSHEKFMISFSELGLSFTADSLSSLLTNKLNHSLNFLERGIKGSP